jgi:pyridoxamine 5'-phosphate oxidase-like protein
MSLTPDDLEFLKDHHSAAMITVAADGMAKVARVGVALVDGKLWSSGTRDRVRTKRLRGNPQCTLFVFDTAPPGFGWLALETTVAVLDGPDVPAHSVRLFREMQVRPTGPLSWFAGELTGTQFLQAMVDEGRLIYEFEVHRSYGLH